MDTRISKKACLLGDFAVGKTSLVRRFVYDMFEDRYISTIGVKVSRKTVAVPRGSGTVELVMMLWDLAGSEQFDRVRASYLRGTAGALLVCDLTRPETLDSLKGYVKDLRSVSAEAKLILAANKQDLVTPNVPHLEAEKVEALAGRLDIPFYFTSAKTGDEVERAFRCLGSLLAPE
jgi:small GTP-binding protein